MSCPSVAVNFYDGYLCHARGRTRQSVLVGDYAVWLIAKGERLLAALTPIHPHLAVQYLTQLPHVMLLTATLRQGVPTSLSKCVFRGGRSLRLAWRSAMRDKPDLCSCGYC